MSARRAYRKPAPWSFHLVAQCVGFASAAAMMTFGLLSWLLTSDWFLNKVNTPQSTHDVLPVEIVSVVPELVLVLGFVTLVAALCGAFQKQA